MANESHCTRVVRHVLETIYPVQPLKGQNPGYPHRYSIQQQPRLIVASYAQHFHYLWGIGVHKGKGFMDELAALCEKASEQRPFDLCLINEASSQTEEADRDAAKRTTVYDYLVALTLFLQKQRKEGLPHLRLVVLDSVANQSIQFFGGRMFLKLLPQFGWIRIFPLNWKRESDRKPSLEGFLTCLTSSADSDFDTLSNRAFLSGGAAVHMNELASLLRPVWLGELGRAEEHHDVANLLSPLVLVAGLEKLKFPGADQTCDKIRGRSERALALGKLMEFLDTPSAPMGNVAGSQAAFQSSSSTLPPLSPLNGKLVKHDFFGRFESGVKFLLIDDKALTGFDRILANLLFGKDEEDATPPDGTGNIFRCVSHTHKQFSLECRTTPEIILSQVEALVQQGEKDGYARTLPTTFGRASFDILLLDLRLFSGSEIEEQMFLQTVQSICTRPGFKKLLQESKSQIAVRLKYALEAVRLRLEKTSTASLAGTPELLHLTCLPLLVTFLDPSSPIIIFSSTQQRSVVEMFASFPNIITTFSKPVFGRYSAESRSSEDHALSLKKALVRALELHEERLIWERLSPEKPLLNPNSRFAFGLKNKLLLDEEKQLRSVFHEGYLEYLNSGRYFDACSIPWEAIEGRIGREYKVSDFAQDHHFAFQDQLRSRKTHGGVMRPQTEQQLESWRTATILQWLLFLDLLQHERLRDKRVPPDNIPDANWLKSVFFNDHGKAAGFQKWRFNDLREGCLNADAWLPFVVFGAASLLTEAFDEGIPSHRFVSEASLRAINKLCENCFPELQGKPIGKSAPASKGWKKPHP